MQVAREFTHERTKQRIVHLNALAMAPAVRAQLATPQRSPWGQGMTRQADRFFMQQQLREMNFDKPAFVQHPTLLGTQPESPEREQFDSAREDVEEEEGGATSALNAEPDASMGEETEASGHSPGRPLPRGAAGGIAPYKGSVPGHVENFKGLRISILVSHCFERLLKRMPFPIGIGVARLKMPCRGAMMLPRLRKLCSRPWRGWPGTMPR